MLKPSCLIFQGHEQTDINLISNTLPQLGTGNLDMTSTTQQYIQFIEFITDDFESIRHTMEQLGVNLVASHRFKKIYLFEANHVALVVNCEMQEYAKKHFESHGSSILGVGLVLNEPEKVLETALYTGYQTQNSVNSLSGLSMPSIQGEGGVLTYAFSPEQWTAMMQEEFDYTPNQPQEGATIKSIDHIAINVKKGQLEKWRYFYEVVLNLKETSNFIIDGKKTSFRCNPLGSECGNIRVVLNEDFEDGSQISEYIKVNNGPGVQHIAFDTTDIYHAIESRKHSQVRFMTTPDTYYNLIDKRIKHHGEDLERMRKNHILIDNDKMNQDKILLQIFTDTMIGPIFFEFIQRKGNNGFGEGNVKTLFEAVEIDQMERGVLA
ncbi:4-hydroxyphenylpyruvate dioxygenase [Alteromonas sp. a30]|uniref:4-hydroxyphenylpyruvate dioxygenase n=1 Tax=Alteromonas sp. a30 TaxID=2730917 RepID=UPI002282FEED|nr:4-hydroxyphenylpyruvate dioxygenase [Alteromonas sp. a30]MCY7295540.1 4-hydroxyphenylpyruvate dioxygenase [Alteromonas sp. a30]